MLEVGQKVQIQYAGSIENGNTFVNTWINGGPVEVTVGDKAFLPAFERALRNLSRGERISIVIPMQEAYGAYDEANVVRVPRETVSQVEKLSAGSSIVVQTALGQARVKVAAIDQETVTIDCNHELAGHDITFEIELVRDGSEGTVDGEKGPHQCGCGCDKLKEQLAHHSHECACER